jgi:RNA polymerase sigma-70 factor (ECF subfamily)
MPARAGAWLGGDVSAIDVGDEELVSRVQGGDAAAFAALVERYTRMVYRTAYRLLGSAEEAEDAAQEAFVRAYVKLGSYREDTSFRAWLLAITTNRCIDRYRTRAQQARRTLRLGAWLDWHDADDAHTRPEATALDRERRRLVRRWVAALPASHRQVVALRYFDELSYAEIAAALGQTSAAVKMRLHRARKLLRQAGHPEQG